MPRLWLDFETRSRCNLQIYGVYNYVQHPSTDIICLSYAFDDDPVTTWLPHQAFPSRIADHINNNGQICAHNAAFERLIFEYVLSEKYKTPIPKLSQWYCTAAQARANCAPGSLGDVGRFFGAEMRKDYRGAQLIRLLSLPLPDGTFRRDDKLLQEMVTYCQQDVRTMRSISLAMRPLSKNELRDYHINELINDRGLLVDTDLAKAAIRYSVDETKEIEDLVREITHGTVNSVRSAKMRKWVQERVGSEALKLMTTDKDGIEKISIDKTVRANLLQLAEEDPNEVPPHVADVIQCADDIWASSVAKFVRMFNIADAADQHVRGAFVFAGGAATGRAASYGIQLHNLTRTCAENPEVVRQSMVQRESLVPTYGKRVTEVLKSMLRPTIMAQEGHSLIVADWASIEARVLPWLSSYPTAKHKLELFKQGVDIYKVNAAATFHVELDEVTKAQRQIGKIQELACGFSGGVGAFNAMSTIYKMQFNINEAKSLVAGWRAANSWAPMLWDQIQNAYLQAIQNKGAEFSAGKVTYLFDGLHLWYSLPSKRVLCYPFLRVEGGEITYAKAAWKPAADAKEWPRAKLWVGVAVENIVQATAHDLLRESLYQCETKGLYVIGHVHDEIIVEAPNDVVEEKKNALKLIMTTPPAWAADLPLDVEISHSLRYGK